MDYDGPGKSITLVKSPNYGSISLALDGSYTYTPNPNYFGRDTVVYHCIYGTLICDDTANGDG
ncbi:MAG: Ig-like domain-containing protein [Chitinophagales bacterium]